MGENTNRSEPFFDEDVDPCGHAHAYGIAKLFKVFFQLIVDAYANRCLCHDSPLLSIQASQDFLNLFLHFLVFFFQGIDSFILGCIVRFNSRDFFSLIMDCLCHFSLADAVVCGAFANLEGDTGIEARVAVAKRNAHVDHGIGIRLIEGTDSGCIGRNRRRSWLYQPGRNQADGALPKHCCRLPLC